MPVRRSGARTRRFVGIAGAVLLCVATVVSMSTSTAYAATTVTSYAYSSTPGDWIGQGLSNSYVSPASTISIVSGSDAGELNVQVTSGSDWWYISLAAPSGSTLVPGTYLNAERAPFRSAGHPGIDVSGNGRGCNRIFGQFVLRSISADASGNITELDASYVQHCETATAPALTGTIRVNAPTGAPTTLVPTNPASVAGEGVAFAANVDPGSGGTATGTVTFKDGANPLATVSLDASAMAVLSTAALGAGTHSITATYNGDATHAASTSDAAIQTVSPNTTSYWYTGGSANYIGQGATASFTPASSTMTITGTAADLTVYVSAPDANWTIRLAAAPGQTLTPGTYTDVQRAAFRTAGHPGLDVYGQGRGCNNVFGSFVINRIGTDGAGAINLLDATIVQNCEQLTAVPLLATLRWNAPATPAVSVVASPSPALVGQPVTLTATIAGSNGTPTGTVTFTDGANALGTATLDASGVATLTTSSLAVGTHTIGASWAGNADYLAGSASTTLTVQLHATSTALHASSTNIKRGKAVTFTATVTGAGPTKTGTVTFFDGATAVGTATLSGSGTAAVTTSFSTNGAHNMTARYNGDAAHAPSTSPVVTVTVR
jgi:hypothetical protein